MKKKIKFKYPRKIRKEGRCKIEITKLTPTQTLQI